MTNKEVLHLVFDKAREADNTYIAISVLAEGQSRPEMILFHRDDFDFKQDYYDRTYDENLNHRNGLVRILAIMSSCDFSDLNTFSFACEKKDGLPAIHTNFIVKEGKR